MYSPIPTHCSSIDRSPNDYLLFSYYVLTLTNKPGSVCWPWVPIFSENIQGLPQKFHPIILELQSLSWCVAQKNGEKMLPRFFYLPIPSRIFTLQPLPDCGVPPPQWWVDSPQNPWASRGWKRWSFRRKWRVSPRRGWRGDDWDDIPMTTENKKQIPWICFEIYRSVPWLCT